MGIFELNDCKMNKGNIDDLCTCKNSLREENRIKLNPRRIREENIISLKIYDSCRQQDCLDPFDLGPCRAAECVTICNNVINEGDVIVPPADSASVSVDKLKVKKVLIVSKEPSCFKKGYWDISLKYIFEYRLIFREANGSIIGSIKANSIFNKTLTLFGSEGCDLVISTDLFDYNNSSSTLDAEPFVLVESKAIALSAELKYPDHCQPLEISSQNPKLPADLPIEVNITIGLFSIVKLFRIVDLSVESKGFTIPKECDGDSKLNPCSYFNKLDFPMDLFAPPQKPEFKAGISSNIPRAKKECGCE